MRVAHLLATTTQLLDPNGYGLITPIYPTNLPSTLVKHLRSECTQHQLDLLSQWPSFDFAHALGAIRGEPQYAMAENPEATQLLLDGIMRCCLRKGRFGPPQPAWPKPPLLINATLVDLLVSLRRHLPVYANGLHSQVVKWQSLIGMQNRGKLLCEMQNGDHLTFAFDPACDASLSEDDVKVVEVERVQWGYRLFFWLPHPKLATDQMHSYHAQTLDTVGLEAASRLMNTHAADLVKMESGLRWMRWTKKRVYDGPLPLRLVLLLILQSGLRVETIPTYFQAKL